VEIRRIKTTKEKITRKKVDNTKENKLEAANSDVFEVTLVFEWAHQSQSQQSPRFTRNLQLQVPFNLFLERLANDELKMNGVQIVAKRLKTGETIDREFPLSSLQPPLEQNEVIQLVAIDSKFDSKSANA